MKYLAILKDSLREAIDTKVFFVMIGLSAVLTLLTATLTFQPEPGEELMKAMALPLFGDLADLNPERLMQMARDPGAHLYEVKGAEPLDGAPEGPSSPYVVSLVAHCQSPEEAEKLKKSPGPSEQLIRDKFGRLDEMRIVNVTETRLANPGDPFVPRTPAANEVYFRVNVQPTPVARRLWPNKPSLFFGAVPLSFLGKVPLGFQLYFLEDKIVGGLGAWAAILVSIVLTSFFIPNMLRKGTVDLLLVKPIHRTTLLLYKYLGGLIFIFLNTAVVVLGIWLALGWRSGIWAPSFLLMVFVISFFFAILYAVSTLFGVLTRSAIVAILMSCAVWFFLFLVGALYQVGEGIHQEEERDNAPVAERTSENLFFTGVRAVHFVLPRTQDLDHLSSHLLIRDLLTDNQIKAQKIDKGRISWGESLTVSGVFIALMLGLACWRFSTKDY